MKLLVLNGPNINMLALRNSDIYGDISYQQLVDIVTNHCKQINVQCTVLHSNSEGQLIDILQQHIGNVDGVIINAGAYTHYSYALRDCMEYLPMPTVSVHLSDITKRETWRQQDVFEDVVDKIIMGKGIDSYIQAIDYLVEKL